ncbi:MAG TPA: DUF6089 family protein [Bacteroidia bacterium]
MRRLLFAILLFFFFLPFADAQHMGKRRKTHSFHAKPPYRYELIGSLGASNFLGDLGGANQIGTHGLKDLNLVMTRPVEGASIRFKVQQFFSVKTNFYWAILRGDDKLTQEPSRHARNLNFKSNVFELSSQVEFNFIKEQKGHIYKIRGVRGMKHKDRQIYLFGGAGLIHFNPKGLYTDGKWYALEPLHTEGVSYSRFTPIISVGGGLRFAINRYWGVGMEIGMRKTFSDYVDDVSKNYPNPDIFNGNPKAIYLSNPALPGSAIYGSSATGQQRGDPTHKDAYMFGTLTVGYKVMYRRRSRSKF